MNPLSLAEAAYGYALGGFLVLPLHYPKVNSECSCGGSSCRAIGKHPLTGHGVSDASGDLGIVQGWWERWPNANIGLATGTVSGVVVVDIDDTTAFESLGLEPIETLTCQTGRGDGSVHLYFRPPVQLITSKTLIKGVDIKGEKGYVVAPPSLHVSGDRYEFAENDVLSYESLREVPPDLLLTILEQQTKPVTQRSRSKRKSSERTEVSASLRLVGRGYEDIKYLRVPWNAGDVKCHCPSCGKVWKHTAPSNGRGPKRAPKRCTGCGMRLRL